MFTLATRGASPVYFPDDPLQVDNDRALDAGKAVRIEGSNGYDFAEQTFLKPGDHRRDTGRQRQHHRRSPGLELVHQPDRPPRHVGR